MPEVLVQLTLVSRVFAEGGELLGARGAVISDLEADGQNCLTCFRVAHPNNDSDFYG